MKFHWLRGRAIVHATEDEERVRDALAWSVGLDQVERGADRVERQRAKGHYGNDIIILEASVKRDADIVAALGRLFADPRVRNEVRGSLALRLDEDHVLHVRLDKQALIGRRIALGTGSDAVIVTAKVAAYPGEVPQTSWEQFLDAGATPPT